MKRSNVRSRTIMLLFSLIAVTICVPSHGLSGRHIDNGENGDETCTPFALAHLSRGLTVSSAVLSSHAFEACLKERALRYHLDCPNADPWTSVSMTTQVYLLLQAMRAGQHVRTACYNATNQDRGGEQPTPTTAWASDDQKAWHTWRHWTLAHWDTGWPAVPGMPWQYDAAGVLHEFSHTLGYDHPEHDCTRAREECAAYPATSECGWLRYCGGTGLPPTGYYPQGYGSRNRCAVQLGLGEAGYVNGDGDPSFPYIISDCAYGLVEQSAAECTGGLFPLSCGDDEVQLLSTWTGRTQDFGGTCACSPAQQHRVAFRTGSGHFLQASNEGGGAFTAQGTGRGPWQTLFIFDENGGYLEHNDLIRIRTYRADEDTGYFVGSGSASGSEVVASYTSRDNSYVRFRIVRQAGAGRVLSGDIVSLYNYQRGRYVTAVNNGGSIVVSDAMVASTWERFTYLEPRRALLVNFRTNDGRYVTYDTTNADLTTVPLEPEIVSGIAQREARTQSFWIVDVNGGALEHNDEVYIEWSLDMQHWTTCVSGTTGNVRGEAVYENQACQRFRVVRQAGAGVVGHRDQINIVSVGQRRYLSAIPSGFANRFRIRNEATVPRTWENFRIDFAQGRDSTTSRFAIY